MEAIILAGGFGTRLRPLTCTRPKLMFPIANRPLLDWTLESLARRNIKKVILAVNYMAEVIEKSIGSSRYGMRIEYSRETKPLGTGGPIKKAENLLDNDETFFVLNGDILSGINYTEMQKVHGGFNAEATIALHEVEDPSSFGIVEMNGKDQVMKFIEKPEPEKAPSKLANAGVYVLKRTVLEGIPHEAKVSIEREVFPKLAERGELYGYRFDGLWADVGKPKDYMSADMRMLDDIAKDKPIIGEGVKIHSDAMIHTPAAIGDRVVVGEGSSIGPYVSIGNDTNIGRGTKIQNSIIFPRVWIDNFTSIKGAIVGEATIVGQWVKIEDQCIVGDYVNILDNVTLTKKVKICHSKEVDSSILDPGAVM